MWRSGVTRLMIYIGFMTIKIYKGAHCLGLNWIVLLEYSNQKFPLQGFFNIR